MHYANQIATAPVADAGNDERSRDSVVSLLQTFSAAAYDLKMVAEHQAIERAIGAVLRVHTESSAVIYPL